MGDNQNFTGDEEEILILVDEDGNEIIDELPPDEEVLLEEELPDEPTIVMDDVPENIVLPMEEEESFELDSSYFVKDEEDEESYDSDNGTVVNRVLGIFGALIALVAIVVGIIFIASRNKTPEVDFSDVGSRVAEIGVIGNENIRAIAEAKGAYIDDINEAIKSYNYTEADTEDGITTVNLELTSIIKDLKIKFTNKYDKLIPSVPFEVEVSCPDGKTVTWTDTDKDGIIYQTDLAGGTYNIKLVNMTGYDSMYDFSANSTKSIVVKTQLDYQKVNVKNEIKVQNSSNASEDAAENDTVVESKLTDTVAFAVSDKKASSGYEVISKSNVQDPVKTATALYEASLFRFRRLSGPVNVDNEEKWTGTGNGKHSRNKSVSEGEPETETEDCVDGDGNGACDICGAAMPGTSEDPDPEEPQPGHEHKYGEPVSNKDGKTHTKKCTATEGTCNAESVTEDCSKFEYVKNDDGLTHNKLCSECGQTIESKIECEADTDGKCKYCKRDMAVSGNAVIQKGDLADGFVLDFTKNKEGKGKISVKTEITSGTATEESYTYKWTIETGTEFLKFSSADDKKEVEITGLKSGEATVKCVVTLGDKKTTFVATQKITVVSPKITFDIKEKKKVVFIDGEKLLVTAKTEGFKTNKVTWSSSDTNLATVTFTETANEKLGTSVCTVVGVKPGTVKLVCKSLDDEKILEELTVIVAVHPKNDKATKLLDTNQKQVYVYDSSKKEYREATYADYYTGTDLYTAVDVVYTYSGWWTIDGKTYFFDKNGKKVTGDQVILGAKYSFDSSGVLKSGTGLFGIDVSTFNGTIDWNKVAKSGVSFAIIRCGLRGSTAGALYEDAKFATNIKNATAAGIKVGLYFFTQALNEAEAVEEASMCLTLAEGNKISYPIFIDIESATNGRANALSKEQRTNVALAFCKTITNGGYKAGVYSNKTWFTNYLDASKLTGYSIWLAQYASAPTYTTTRYDLWQYSCQGSLNGISGEVDLNLSYLGY